MSGVKPSDELWGIARKHPSGFALTAAAPCFTKAQAIAKFDASIGVVSGEEHSYKWQAENGKFKAIRVRIVPVEAGE